MMACVLIALFVTPDTDSPAEQVSADIAQSTKTASSKQTNIADIV